MIAEVTCIWDFAGPPIYYITHPNSLKSDAVYLIEFNLMENMQGKKRKCKISRMAKETMTNEMTIIQIIKYRMELIFTYAVQAEQQQLKTKKPKIVVVGTHFKGTSDEKEQAAEQFRILFQEIKSTPYESYVVRKMYLIDNESSSGSKFQEKLEQDICGFLNAMPNTIPLTWFNLQRLLQEMGEKEMHVDYDEVCKVATQCGILKENLKHTLNYLHDLGIVMYFQDNRQLRDTVVLNPRKVSNITEELITAVKTDDEMVS
ncbi:probable serine/threonine-protein kinase roco4 [Anneissia japonica]|uniref:probable serine/threonine-protein kinase roco4 n=1 Tax=Anneissia japonica TaxID=1529436 RepID=UPI0014257B19|nr:probable serine/threonine-protein kinase roco4 [Anneissia japonica]